MSLFVRTPSGTVVVDFCPSAKDILLAVLLKTGSRSEPQNVRLYLEGRPLPLDFVFDSIAGDSLELCGLLLGGGGGLSSQKKQEKQTSVQGGSRVQPLRRRNSQSSRTDLDKFFTTEEPAMEQPLEEMVAMEELMPRTPPTTSTPPTSPEKPRLVTEANPQTRAQRGVTIETPFERLREASRSNLLSAPPSTPAPPKTPVDRSGQSWDDSDDRATTAPVVSAPPPTIDEWGRGEKGHTAESQKMLERPQSAMSGKSQYRPILPLPLRWEDDKEAAVPRQAPVVHTTDKSWQRQGHSLSFSVSGQHFTASVATLSRVHGSKLHKLCHSITPDGNYVPPTSGFGSIVDGCGRIVIKRDPRLFSLLLLLLRHGLMQAHKVRFSLLTRELPADCLREQPTNDDDR